MGVGLPQTPHTGASKRTEGVPSAAITVEDALLLARLQARGQAPLELGVERALPLLALLLVHPLAQLDHRGAVGPEHARAADLATLAVRVHLCWPGQLNFGPLWLSRPPLGPCPGPE